MYGYLLSINAVKYAVKSYRFSRDSLWGSGVTRPSAAGGNCERRRPPPPKKNTLYVICKQIYIFLHCVQCRVSYRIFFRGGGRASDGKGVCGEAPPGFFLNLRRSNIDLQPFLSFNLHNLAHLMRIAIEGPVLSSVNFEEVLKFLKRKSTNSVIV